MAEQNNGGYRPITEGAGGRTPKPTTNIRGDGARAPKSRPTRPPKK